MSRKQISTRRRFEVFKRDGFQCQYCGKAPPTVVLHVDHIVAVANGGGNEDSNLVTACQDCNLGKSAVPLASVPKSLDEVAAEREEAAEQLRQYAEIIRESQEALESVCWVVADTLNPDASKGWNAGYFRSVKMFVKRLGYAETLEAAEIASEKMSPSAKQFKYFCGVCWNMIKDREE